MTSDPGSLHRVLEEVLDLGQEQLDELALLLDRTTFAGIMAMSRAVAERLEFLRRYV